MYRVCVLLLLVICPIVNFDKQVKTIHFVETTIGSKYLKMSQRCALEAAKKYHPYANIILWSLEKKIVAEYIENRVFDWRLNASKYFDVTKFESKLRPGNSNIYNLCKYIILFENGGLLLHNRMILRREFVLTDECRIEFAKRSNGNLSTSFIYSSILGHPIFDNILYKLDEQYNAGESISSAFLTNHVLYQCEMENECKTICVHANLYTEYTLAMENKNTYACSKKSSNYKLSESHLGIIISTPCIPHKDSLFLKLARQVCPMTIKTRKNKILTASEVSVQSSTKKKMRMLEYLFTD